VHTYTCGRQEHRHFWSIKSKQGNLSYIMESSYLRDKNTIQMNMRDNQFGLSQCSILMRDSFSARDYTNSLEEKVSLKRHKA